MVSISKYGTLLFGLSENLQNCSDLPLNVCISITDQKRKTDSYVPDLCPFKRQSHSVSFCVAIWGKEKDEEPCTIGFCVYSRKVKDRRIFKLWNTRKLSSCSQRCGTGKGDFKWMHPIIPFLSIPFLLHNQSANIY